MIFDLFVLFAFIFRDRLLLLWKWYLTIREHHFDVSEKWFVYRKKYYANQIICVFQRNWIQKALNKPGMEGLKKCTVLFSDFFHFFFVKIMFEKSKDQRNSLFIIHHLMKIMFENRFFQNSVSKYWKQGWNSDGSKQKVGIQKGNCFLQSAWWTYLRKWCQICIRSFHLC